VACAARHSSLRPGPGDRWAAAPAGQKREEAEMTERIASFAEFWPHYLRAHGDPRTRAMHYCGTSLGVLLLIAFAVSGDWRCLVAAPVTGYALAMASHALFEGNRPASFGHPVWSFAADFYMVYLWATGQIAPEIERVARRA
jgi:hypothetical protein